MNEDDRKEALAVLAGLIAADHAESAASTHDEGQDARDPAYEAAYKAAGGSFERGWDADLHSGTTPENVMRFILNG